MTENNIERPHWVIFAAVLMFLSGLFSLVFAISTFSNASWLADFKVDIGGKLWISGIVLLVLAAACIIAGVSLLQGKKFGLYFSFAFALISMAIWFFLIFWFPVMALVALGISLLTVYALVKSYDYFDEYARLGIPQ